jgi:hypothetical protein
MLTMAVKPLTLGVLQSQLNETKAKKETLRRLDHLSEQEADLEKRIAKLSSP